MFFCKKASWFDQSPAQCFSSMCQWFCCLSDFCAYNHGEIELVTEVLEGTEGDAVSTYVLLTPGKQTTDVEMCWNSSRQIRNAFGGGAFIIKVHGRNELEMRSRKLKKQ